MIQVNAIRFSKAALVAATVSTAGFASAAPITWSGPIDNATSGPVNNGSVVEAVNVGGPAATINGISFLAGDAADPAGSDVFTALGAGNSGSGAPSGATPAFATVLDSHRWANGAGAATVTFTGLSIGTEYSIQTAMVDIRGCCSGRTKFLGDTDGGTDSATFARGDNVSFIGTFTADATSQSLTVNVGAGSTDPGLSYYVLSEGVVPEPSSLALLGLSGLFVARRRRC